MLDIQGRKYASVTVCDVTLYDIMTKYPVMFFDTLQVTSIDSSAETTDIQGGQGNSTLASISHTKTVNVQFDDAIMTMSSLAILTGGTLEHGDEGELITMTETELVTVKAGESKLKLSKTAKKGSYVWAAKMIDGILSTATRTELKSGLADETDEIDFSDFHNPGIFPDANADTVYRVFYEHEIKLTEGDASELTVLADKFAGTYRFIGDTVLFNQYTGGNDLFQIEIPKLKLNSSYSMSFSAATEAIVFSFAGQALRDDFGQMIIFRQLRADNAIEGGDLNGNNQIYDGLYRAVPAVPVSIAEDGEIIDLSI